MSNVTGCQVGYKTQFNTCNDCERAPYESEKCLEFTHNKIDEKWYFPKPFLTLITDVPIEHCNMLRTCFGEFKND